MRYQSERIQGFRAAYIPQELPPNSPGVEYRLSVFSSKSEHGAARGKDSRAEKTRQLSLFLADGRYLPVKDLSESRTSVTYPIITDVIWPSYPHSGTLL